MSKSFRRRLLFASLRDVAFASLLSAALVGSVGCAGGSNPFCCDSKEKDQIDNLERAQSLDENEKNSTSTEEDSDEQKEEKKTIFADNPQTDGSGDASLIAAAQDTPKTFAPEAQVVPVTASTIAAQDATDSSGLLQAPVLPTQAQTPEVAAPAPTPSETATTETPDAPTVEETATTADETPSSESQEAQNKGDAQAETPKEESAETQEEKAPETPVNVARTSRRDGPQRAATRQVAQRAAAQTVAVPQTRAAATLPAPVVTFRTRVVVP